MTRYWFFSEGQFQSCCFPLIIRKHYEKFQLCFNDEELITLENEAENLNHFLNLLSDQDYNREFFTGLNLSKKLKLFTLSEMLFYLDLPAAHVRDLLEKNESTLDELNSIFLMKKNQNLCSEQIKAQMQEIKSTKLVPILILINITRMFDKHKSYAVEIESPKGEETIPFPPMPSSSL